MRFLAVLLCAFSTGNSLLLVHPPASPLLRPKAVLARPAFSPVCKADVASWYDAGVRLTMSDSSDDGDAEHQQDQHPIGTAPAAFPVRDDRMRCMGVACGIGGFGNPFFCHNCVPLRL